MDMAELVDRDLPAFHRTFIDIKESCQTMTKDLKLELERMRNGGAAPLKTAAGVSLLDVKNLAMMSYASNLLGIVKSKLNGVSLTETGFVERTTESRTVLEKIRPLEKKIAYQIDKIVTEDVMTRSDPLNHAPDVGDLAASDDDDEDDDAASVPEEEDGDINDIQTDKYVPPHIAQMQYNERNESKTQRTERERQRAIQRSSVIADLVEDATDAPMEISNYADDNDRKKAVRQRDERKNYEEANMTRVMRTKKEKNRELQTMRRSALDTITHFGHSDKLYNDSASSPSGSQNKGKKRGAKGKKGRGGKRRRH